MLVGAWKSPQELANEHLYETSAVKSATNTAKKSNDKLTKIALLQLPSTTTTRVYVTLHVIIRWYLKGF